MRLISMDNNSQEGIEGADSRVVAKAVAVEAERHVVTQLARGRGDEVVVVADRDNSAVADSTDVRCVNLTLCPKVLITSSLATSQQRLIRSKPCSSNSSSSRSHLSSRWHLSMTDTVPLPQLAAIDVKNRKVISRTHSNSKASDKVVANRVVRDVEGSKDTP